jgi:hypothetical protein
VKTPWQCLRGVGSGKRRGAGACRRGDQCVVCGESGSGPLMATERGFGPWASAHRWAAADQMLLLTLYAIETTLQRCFNAVITSRDSEKSSSRVAQGPVDRGCHRQADREPVSARHRPLVPSRCPRIRRSSGGDHSEIRDHRKHQWRFGETTDDTERTIAVARAVLRDGEVRHVSVGRELLTCKKSVHPGVKSLWEFHEAGDAARVTLD